MGRRAKRIEVFDADRFYNENRELCEKYFKKDTKNLIIEDIDCPKEQLLDNRVGIPDFWFYHWCRELLNKKNCAQIQKRSLLILKSFHRNRKSDMNIVSDFLYPSATIIQNIIPDGNSLRTCIFCIWKTCQSRYFHPRLIRN